MHSRRNPDLEPQIELFRIELVRMVDLSHPMVKLAESIDWGAFAKSFDAMWSDSHGRPAIDTRLMVSLHYLKYTFDLSDEAVVEAWLQNPYWQFLSGMRYFEHRPPLDPSSMSRWRGRAGQHGLEELLQQSVQAGLKLKAITPVQLARVNIDTTVEEKHVRFPTDSRLYDRARERLVKAARKAGLLLRQSYVRVGKHLLLMQSRYAHAKQYRRAQRCQKKLRTLLGRVLRDIEARKDGRSYPKLDQLMAIARRIHAQERHDKNKVYSVHAPEVECISKGKAHKRYEFGVKVSVATTSRGGWHVGAMSCPGNPYDGHTLQNSLKQVQRVSGTVPGDVFVDMGYRGHQCAQEKGAPRIHVAQKRRGSIPKALWKWMRRRAAVEPGIGHLKAEHRLDRNRLWDSRGDMANAVLSAAGMNFHKLLRHLSALWRALIAWLCRALPSPVGTSPQETAGFVRRFFEGFA
jgi:IS5 family transposase